MPPTGFHKALRPVHTALISAFGTAAEEKPRRSARSSARIERDAWPAARHAAAATIE